MGDGAHEQVGELPERVLADVVAVRRPVGELRVAVDRDVEVVLPELGHHLEHRSVGAHPSLQHPPLVVVHHLPAGLLLADLPLPQLGGRVRQLGPPGVDLADLLVGDAARLELALEPRRPAARLAHVARELGRQAVGEAGHQVPVGLAQQRRSVVLLATGGVRRVDGRRDGDGRGREGTADEGAAARGRSRHECCSGGRGCLIVGGDPTRGTRFRTGWTGRQYSARVPFPVPEGHARRTWTALFIGPSTHPGATDDRLDPAGGLAGAHRRVRRLRRGGVRVRHRRPVPRRAARGRG